MDEEWDTDNFTLKEPVAVSANKWEGEDEEEDVKESWDAEEEEEEKKDVEKPEPKKVKPKKSLADKIAEKERLQMEELELKIKEKEKEKEEEPSPEEKLRMQKESDLQVALETTFGVVENHNSIENMNPTTKEEFAELSEALNQKVQSWAKSQEFAAFAEDHIRNVCVLLNSLDLKKLKTTIDVMYIEKQKLEKGEKGEKARKSKGKGKAKLRMEGDNALTEYSAYGDYVEHDDFM